MSRSRRLRLRLALFAVLGLLFAQWSIAAYACTVGILAQSAATHADCGDAVAASGGALCHKHCIGDEGGSRVDASALSTPALAPQRALASEHPPLAPHAASLRVLVPWHRPPPLAILPHRLLT